MNTHAATKTVAVEVVSYDEGTDSFLINIPRPEQGEDFNESWRLYVNDFLMPAGLFAHLVGEFGEPNEFIGRGFKLLSRA